MNERPLLRFLDLVRRELGAKDARAEVGGHPPDDPCIVFASLNGDWRVVAIFEEPVDDLAQQQERLQRLIESFAGIGASAVAEAPPIASLSPARTLEDTLHTLAERADAVRAVIVDDQSPVLWGSSEPRRGEEDVETAMQTAATHRALRDAGVDMSELLGLDDADARERLSGAGMSSEEASRLAEEVRSLRELSGRRGEDAWRQHLLTTRAIAAVRSGTERSEHRFVVHEEGFGCIGRAFANIYWLILVFEGDFSELHAEGAMVHALPIVEKLVMSLPPVDPTPGKGRVLRMRRLREV